MITWIIGPLLLRYSQRNVPIMQCDIREDLPSYRRRIFLPTNQYHFCGGVLHNILINMINSNIKRIVACYQQFECLWSMRFQQMRARLDVYPIG